MQNSELIRGVGLRQATALNMIDMIGVGPFITIPLIIAAMGGPQAMLGWILGAILCICDGLVWAELGAAMPEAGGSYRYLKEIYNPKGAGKIMAFLFIFQLTFSAPLSIASGCIGLASYAEYLWSPLGIKFFSQTFEWSLPLVGTFKATIQAGYGTLLAIGVCVAAVALLYRKITDIGKFSWLLWGGVMLTIIWVIFTGLTHFNPSRAFDFPPDAFVLSPQFFFGLGSAMLVAIYDYWGYYNVCFFGGEVKNPGQTIPRAVIYSILLVAVIYIVMNIGILGVIPWQELGETAKSDARKYIISVFMQRIYGDWAGILVTILIMWTAFASVFSLLLGYSRVPYAAAIAGDFFRPFTTLHPKHKFPSVSLLTLGGVACLFCFLQLKDVIAALVVVRIFIQFLSQTAGVVLLRINQPNLQRPFRMWLYPLPAVIAFFGFLYVLFARQNFQKEIIYAVGIVVLGLTLYFVKQKKQNTVE